MATYTLAPVAKQQFFDNSGNPLANGRIYTYAAGTTTALSTYQTSSGTAWGAYVQLDSAGRPQTGSIYLPPGTSYKFIAQTSASVVLWTQDNVSAVPPSSVNVDITGTAGVNLAAGDVVYMSKGDGSLTPGSWYLADADLAYASSGATIIGMVPTAIASGDTGTIRIEGDVDVTGPLTPGSDYYVSATAGALTTTAPTNARLIGQAKSVGVVTIVPNPPPPRLKSLCNGRLSLTSGSPVTTGDVTAASTLYWVPYNGNQIGLYTGSAWEAVPFTQTSLALTGLVTAQAYDIFAYNNAGVLALESAEWKNATVTMTIAAPGVVTWTAHGMSTGMSITFTTTSALPTGVSANTQYWITVVDADTFKLSTSQANVAAGTFITTSGSQSGVHTGHQPQARQTALVFQDGVYVKTGATTRRYLGTIFTTSTSTTEDSNAKRFVWNYYNRVRRIMQVLETTNSWSYSTATYRQANGVDTNQLAMVVGVAEEAAALRVMGLAATTVPAAANYHYAAIGQNSTNTPLTVASLIPLVSVSDASIYAIQSSVDVVPAIGYSAFMWLERTSAGGTTTWYGDNGAPTLLQSGISGQVIG